MLCYNLKIQVGSFVENGGEVVLSDKATVLSP